MATQIPSPAEPLAGAAVAGKRWYDFFVDLFRMATETKETAGGINVKASPYKAKGDGSTDDTSAITKADLAAAAAGSFVYFPAGTYAASELDMTAGWHMAPGATILYNGATEGECIRCAATGLVSGDIRIDCDGKEPFTGLYVSGDENEFRSVTVLNAVSADRAWVVRGVYVVGDENRFDHVAIMDFVNTGNTNDSSPQGLVLSGAGTNNRFADVFGRACRSVVVNNSTGHNFFGDVVGVDCDDNVFYAVAGNSYVTAVHCDGSGADSSAAGFRGDASAEIGTITIRQTGTDAIFFGDCGNVSIQSIFVNGNDKTVLYTASGADTGHIKIGTIYGTLVNTPIFYMPSSQGDVRSLTIDSVNLELVLDDGYSGTTLSIIRLDGAKALALGRIRVDIVLDGYVPSLAFYARISDSLAYHSYIDSFRLNLFDDDGVTPYPETSRVVATDGSTNTALAQSLLRIGEGTLDTDGFLRPSLYDGFNIGRLTATAAPTVGTWEAGAVVWAEDPTASVLGWVCTTDGTPGTWEPMLVGSRMPWSGTKTIASGAITITQPGHVTIDTESAAASDDLDTITYSGAQTGDLLILSAANSSRTVVVKDATGNIHLSADFSLDHSRDTIMLIYTSSVWCEVARSDNST